jgi:hypothetical protein
MISFIRNGIQVFGLLLLVFSCNQNARADLVQPVVLVDNALQFQGTLNVTQFTIATFAFSSSNWLVTAREDFIGSEVLPNGFEVRVQHLVAPPGEVVPNPNVLSIILFANSFTPGGPPRGPFTVSAAHGPDLDFLQVSYVPIGSGQSRLIIEASHAAVPEPSTIVLLASGLSIIFSYRIRRRRTDLSAASDQSASNTETRERG